MIGLVYSFCSFAAWQVVVDKVSMLLFCDCLKWFLMLLLLLFLKLIFVILH